MNRLVTFLLLSSLLAPALAQAQEFEPRNLIKASGPAVYYYGDDGMRYAFPNDKVYFSWYNDFSGIETLTDEELAEIPLSGNVTYRPGTRLVKITTDPKVYAVGAGGLLRWITSESLARDLYGSTWASQVHDIPDAFFADYHIGSSITARTEYDRWHPFYASRNIESNLYSGDISEIPSDVPIYPSGTLSEITTEEMDDMTTVSFTVDIPGSEESVITWYETELPARGWAKDHNLFSLLFGTLGLNVYNKDVGTDRQATLTVVVADGMLSVSYMLGPKEEETPVPDLVPIYPAAESFLKIVQPEEPYVLYLGLSADDPQTVFNWYQGQLGSRSWVHIRSEDEEANIIRIYERRLGNHLVNLSLTIGPAELEGYKTGFLVIYGYADREEFQPAP